MRVKKFGLFLETQEKANSSAGYLRISPGYQRAPGEFGKELVFSFWRLCVAYHPGQTREGAAFLLTVGAVNPGEKRHININFLLWLTSRWPWDKRLVVPRLTGPKSLCVRLETQEI